MNNPDGIDQPGSGGEAAALVLEGVSKTIDRTVILREVTLSLPCTDAILLLGANGAGKSTLLRICSGLMRPTAGAIYVSGPASKRALLPTEVGYMGHHSMLYGALTVRENIGLSATLLGLSATVVSQALERWELEKHCHKKPGELSKGLLARSALCRTLLAKPRFVFLDEPTSALDQRSCDILLRELQVLRDAHRGQILLMIATHDLTRLQPIAERVIILSAGSILHDTATTTEVSNISLVERGIEIYLEHNR